MAHLPSQPCHRLHNTLNCMVAANHPGLSGTVPEIYPISPSHTEHTVYTTLSRKKFSSTNKKISLSFPAFVVHCLGGVLVEFLPHTQAMLLPPVQTVDLLVADASAPPRAQKATCKSVFMVTNNLLSVSLSFYIV